MLTGREIKSIIDFLMAYNNIILTTKALEKRRTTNLLLDDVDYDSIASRLAKTAYQLN
jgi:hypothetical protein